MPLSTFSSILARQAGISVVTEAGLANAMVSLTVNDLPIDEVITAAAKQLGVIATRNGNLFYLGALNDNDNALFIGYCPRLNSNAADKAIGTILTTKGKSHTFDDGLIIVNDVPQALQKVEQFLSVLQNARADSWIVQYQIILFRQDAMRDLGMSAGATFNIAAANANSAEAHYKVQAAIDRAVSNGYATILTQPLIVLENGSTASIKDGDRTPLPMKTVTDAGTVTTTGVQYQETGTLVTTTIMDMGQGSARLTTDLSITAVTGYVEEYPIVKGQSVNYTAAIDVNKTYLIAAMEQDENSASADKSFHLGADGTGAAILKTANANLSVNFASNQAKKSMKNVMQVWVRVYRIADMVQ
ncbi:hypothetical protein AGMMS49959_15350 [Planctomycetales bacterium]|nr:hypothetical protein AGMMS49959_15350 [Planctomycetales bacterium]